MSNLITLSAMRRERAGKGAARAVRREGRVPAVIYGERRPADTITLDGRELTKAINRPGFMAQEIELDLGTEKVRVLARDLQLDPVRDTPTHVDFLRVGDDTLIRVHVRVDFTNQADAPGIKRGGVLSIVRRTVEVYCKAGSIPDHLTADVSGYDIGQSIHISAVALPEGVRPTISGRDFTIATITAPSALRGQVAAEAKAGAGTAKT